MHYAGSRYSEANGKQLAKFAAIAGASGKNVLQFWPFFDCLSSLYQYFTPGCLHVWYRRCCVRVLPASQLFHLLPHGHQCQHCTTKLRICPKSQSMRWVFPAALLATQLWAVKSTDNRQCFWRKIYSWNNFTPQLESAIMILSAPVTLLVALWGMTSARTREVCRSAFASRCDFVWWLGCAGASCIIFVSIKQRNGTS